MLKIEIKSGDTPIFSTELTLEGLKEGTASVASDTQCASENPAPKPESLKESSPSKLPFDLYKALEGYPLITRDGRIVKGFEYAPTPGSKYQYVAKVGRYLMNFTSEGAFWSNVKCDERDLFIDGTRIKEYWSNIWGGPTLRLGAWFHSREAANKAARSFISDLTQQLKFTVVDGVIKEVDILPIS